LSRRKYLEGALRRSLGSAGQLSIRTEAFAMLAIALLAVAGAYTLGAAAVAFATA
jgi:hypothetical protein